jgi:hypothetical protein
MLAIAWREEEKALPKNEAINGLFVGQTDVTLNDMWKQAPKQSTGRI